MKKIFKNIFIVIKNNFKSKRAVILYIFLIISIGCIIAIKTLSVDKLESYEIEDKNNDNEVSITSFIVDSFKTKGFRTIDNNKIYSGVINEVNNIDLDNNSVYTGKKFTAALTLFNGVIFQKCKVKGVVNSKKDKLNIDDIKIISEEKVYKENSTDDKIIKDVAFDELSRGGVFYFNNYNKGVEKFVRDDEFEIKELSLQDYVVRNDYTIRANVKGIMYLNEYKSEYNFDGTVIIGSELVKGSLGSTKVINIYEVPLNIE